MDYEEWEKYIDEKVESGIIILAANDALRNTGRVLKLNTNAKFRINVPEYSAELNDRISVACKEVAELGECDGLEYLCLVDTKTVEIVHRESRSENGVGGPYFFAYLRANEDKELVFVHNHNTDGYFSATDMATLLSTPNISAFTAVRLDGVIYHTIKTKGISGERFDELFKEERSEINRLSSEGVISSGERTKLREEIIVDTAIERYTKGLMEFE